MSFFPHYCQITYLVLFDLAVCTEITLFRIVSPYKIYYKIDGNTESYTEENGSEIKDSKL